MSRHFRMPLPPPPSDALTTSGNPTPFAPSTASRMLRTHARRHLSSSTASPRPTTFEPLHGRTRIPMLCASRLAWTLSPTAAMAARGGPTNTAPAASTPAGRSGFSLAWPQPGHTASIRYRRTRSTIRATSE